MIVINYCQFNFCHIYSLTYFWLILSHIRDDDVPAILGGVVGCIALLAVFFGVFGYQWMQRVKTKENTMMMTMVCIVYNMKISIPLVYFPNILSIKIFT